MRLSIHCVWKEYHGWCDRFLRSTHRETISKNDQRCLLLPFWGDSRWPMQDSWCTDLPRRSEGGLTLRMAQYAPLCFHRGWRQTSVSAAALVRLVPKPPVGKNEWRKLCPTPPPQNRK